MLITTVYRLKKQLCQTQDLSLRKYLENSEKISHYKPNYGKQFLYKESESVGEIIIHYIKKLQQLQEKTEKIERQQNTKSGRFSKVGSKAYYRRNWKYTKHIHILAIHRQRIASKKNYFATSYRNLFKTNSFLQHKPATIYTETKHPYINWLRFNIQCDKHKTSNKEVCFTINMYETTYWLKEDDTLA